MTTEHERELAQEARIQVLENRYAELKVEMKSLENAIAENTRVTREALGVAQKGLEVGERVEKSTSGVVDAFDSAKGGLKVLGVMGKVAAALSALTSLGTVAWLAFTKWFAK